GARDVLAVCKIRNNVRSEPAEMIASVDKKTLTEAVRPVDVGVDAEDLGVVCETEQVCVARSCTLKVKVAIEFIFAAESLVQTRLQRILMAAVENRHLIVVERTGRNVRQRIELQQSLRLGADRYDVASEGQAGGR